MKYINTRILKSLPHKKFQFPRCQFFHSQYNNKIPNPVNRDESYLNLSEIDIENQEESRINFDKLPNFNSRIKVNLLLKSVFDNDIITCNKILHELFEKNNKKKSLILVNVNIYTSCLLIFLSKLSNDKINVKVNIFDIKSLIDDYFIFKLNYNKNTSFGKTSSLQIDEINQNLKNCDEKFIVLLIYIYMNLSSTKNTQHFKLTFKQYINDTAVKLNVNVTDLIEYNQIPVNESFEQNNHLVSDTKNISKHSQIDTSQQFMSYQGLCDYIAKNRFDDFDMNENDKRPLYEIYDTLNPTMKLEFMEKYTAFCQTKQLTVEHHCTNLMSDFEKIDKFSSLGKFGNSNNELIYDWYDKIAQQLNDISIYLKDNATDETSLNERDRVLFKYNFYFDLLPKSLLTNLLLSELISNTLNSDTGHVKLLFLINRLSDKFKKIIFKMKSYNDNKPNIFKFFSFEDSLEFFTCLIKIVIENCEISGKTLNKQLFFESLNLIDDFQTQIDPQFLNVSNNGDYSAFKWGLLKSSESPNYKRIGVIKIHPYLLQNFKNFESLFSTTSTYLPMLTPPKKWTSPNDGGYLTDLKPMVSHQFPTVAKYYFNEAHKTGQLNFIYKSLDILGSMGWIINSKVFNVFNQALQFEEGFAKIPPKLNNQFVDLPLPSKPIRENFDSDEIFKVEKFKYDLEVDQKLKEFHKIKSQRILFESIKNLAQALNTNGDIFYLPHMTDFRGRSYPMPSLFTHYNDDHVRALMMFWEPKPLGENGYNWIKYQLAGVYGMDKLSMKDRLKFINENLINIKNSAEHPFVGNQWWKLGEKPWQVLALCFEINSIINFEKNGGKIENFESRIPIHQDGSCNGLQHYAALGADEAGGKAVNLLPGPKHDVYTSVLNLVIKNIENELKFDDKRLAKLSLLILQRKIVKQTVMTSVYGVTQYGAKLQVHERIKDIIENAEIQQQFEGQPTTSLNIAELNQLKQHKLELSSYISLHVLKSISSLFSGAKLIENWLTENTYRLTTSYDQSTINVRKSGQLNGHFFDLKHYSPMKWTSLSGFPIIQFYKHVTQVSPKSSLQRIVINKPHILASVDMRKQLNGIAPNFIHSIDATHMMMTSIAASQHNILFVSVHDSFWTHPNEVEILSKLIREEFLRLHTSEIVQNLREDLKYSVKNSFQLVWVRNNDNLLFVEKIKNLRESFLGKFKKLNKSDLSKCLYQELNNPQEILQIYDFFKPSVYIQDKGSNGNFATLYDEKFYEDKPIKIDFKNFTPLLIPVKILQCPPKGNLDITKVLDSEFFFS